MRFRGTLMALTAGACVLPGAACADVSMDKTLLEDSFDRMSIASVHGQGVWTDPWRYFRVVAEPGVDAGPGYVRVNTTEFGDYNLPGFRNRWSGWIAFAQASLGFSPTVPEPFPASHAVITLRGSVRIVMPQHAYARGIRVGLLADDTEGSTIADIGITSDGYVNGVVVFDGGASFWSSQAPVADRSDWNELMIRLDVSNGTGRLEWNGIRVLVFSHTARGVARLQLGADGQRSAFMPYREQGLADFDRISATVSRHCEGDLDLDGVVHDDDFVLFARQYDRTDCRSMEILEASCAADLTGDGFVDDEDFVVFAARYDWLLCP